MRDHLTTALDLAAALLALTGVFVLAGLGWALLVGGGVLLGFSWALSGRPLPRRSR